ncbi:MAG: hypothetical protein RLY86_4294 [Pseudomonadota bacterium]|jgi:glycosyltransferase involved in cell wall biosynthesis
MECGPGVAAPAQDTAARPVLSVVLPIYNEEATIPVLLARLTAVLREIGVSHEVLCIDDGSRDGSHDALLAHRSLVPGLRILRFSRNFGKEAALTAGLAHATGRAVVVMDSDLQHPPELIPDFLCHWRAGAQMVYARRESRATDGPMRRLATRAFYRVQSSLSDVEMLPEAGDFRLLDRVVVDALMSLPERQRFTKGLMNWVGFRQVAVPYTPAARVAGKSHYSFWKLLRLAFDGLTAFTTAPLRIWSLIGMAVAVPAFLYGVVIVGRTVLFGVDVPGYASVMASMLFLGGVQLVCLGVIGDYLGRVFVEVKGRPVYLVAERTGFEEVPALDPGTPTVHAAAAPTAANEGRLKLTAVRP